MAQIFERGPKRDDGASFITTVEQTIGKRKKLCGDTITVIAGTNQNIDIKFSNSVSFDIKGGHYFAKNSILGDYLEIFVVDKDNILGYGVNFIPPTGNFTEPIYINGVLQSTGKIMVIPEGYYYLGSDTQTSNIPAGLYLRVIYHSTGISNVDFYFNFDVFK